MDNKTAMMELLEWVTEFENKPERPTLSYAKQKIWQLLPKEKEQIENAYWDGGQNIPMTAESCTNYYNQTYTQNNKQHE